MTRRLCTAPSVRAGSNTLEIHLWKHATNSPTSAELCSSGAAANMPLLDMIHYHRIHAVQMHHQLATAAAHASLAPPATTRWVVEGFNPSFGDLPVRFSAVDSASIVQWLMRSKPMMDAARKDVAAVGWSMHMTDWRGVHRIHLVHCDCDIVCITLFGGVLAATMVPRAALQFWDGRDLTFVAAAKHPTHTSGTVFTLSLRIALEAKETGSGRGGSSEADIAHAARQGWFSMASGKALNRPLTAQCSHPWQAAFVPRDEWLQCPSCPARRAPDAILLGHVWGHPFTVRQSHNLDHMRLEQNQMSFLAASRPLMFAATAWRQIHAMSDRWGVASTALALISALAADCCLIQYLTPGITPAAIITAVTFAARHASDARSLGILSVVLTLKGATCGDAGGDDILITPLDAPGGLTRAPMSAIASLVGLSLGEVAPGVRRHPLVAQALIQGTSMATGGWEGSHSTNIMSAKWWRAQAVMVAATNQMHRALKKRMMTVLLCMAHRAVQRELGCRDIAAHVVFGAGEREEQWEGARIILQHEASSPPAATQATVAAEVAAAAAAAPPRDHGTIEVRLDDSLPPGTARFPQREFSLALHSAHFAMRHMAERLLQCPLRFISGACFCLGCQACESFELHRTPASATGSANRIVKVLLDGFPQMPGQCHQRDLFSAISHARNVHAAVWMPIVNTLMLRRKTHRVEAIMRIASLAMTGISCHDARSLVIQTMLVTVRQHAFSVRRSVDNIQAFATKNMCDSCKADVGCSCCGASAAPMDEVLLTADRLARGKGESFLTSLVSTVRQLRGRAARKFLSVMRARQFQIHRLDKDAVERLAKILDPEPNQALLRRRARHKATTRARKADANRIEREKLAEEAEAKRQAKTKHAAHMAEEAERLQAAMRDRTVDAATIRRMAEASRMEASSGFVRWDKVAAAIEADADACQWDRVTHQLATLAEKNSWHFPAVRERLRQQNLMWRSIQACMTALKEQSPSARQTKRGRKHQKQAPPSMTPADALRVLEDLAPRFRGSRRRTKQMNRTLESFRLLVHGPPVMAAAEKPAAEKPEEKPAEEKPAAEKPATEKPAEEKPAEEKPAAGSPVKKSRRRRRRNKRQRNRRKQQGGKQEEDEEAIDAAAASMALTRPEAVEGWNPWCDHSSFFLPRDLFR